MNALVPGLPDGWVYSLREAAENDERERAQALVEALHHLMCQRLSLNVTAVSAVLQNQVLSPLTRENRRRAEAFLANLGIGKI
jgi:hypothetical protein